MAMQRKNKNLKMTIQRLNRQLSNNSMNTSESSLQQYLQESKITKKEILQTKKENNLLQKENEQLTRELLEYKKRNVALQYATWQDNVKHGNSMKECKRQCTKLLQENQKLKVDMSKAHTKVTKQ